MQRLLIALGAWFGLGLAQGLVLPFDGPGGRALALALADALNAPSPVLADLTLPEPPWPQGWSAVTGDPNGPDGARLVYEATGADWVLVGRVHADGWIDAYLYRNGGTARARFSEPELLVRWLALELGRPARALAHYPELEHVLTQLIEGFPDEAAGELLDLPEPARARASKEVAGVKALFGHGLDRFPEGLPAAVRDYWEHRTEPDAMADAGVGPVWKAFYPLMRDDRETAGEHAHLLMQSDRALDVAGALLLLRALDDEDWPEAARRLTEVAPELVLGWEELSFAAFDAGDAETARRALERAIELDPDEGLYWTNLGWARYLLDDLPGAIAASLRAMEVEPNPTAAYNLGLFHALARDHERAFAYYLEALRLDDEDVVPMALQDLAETHRTDLIFWQGFLLERTGRNQEAAQAYRGFLAEHPDHPLAASAREALEALARVQTRVELLGFKLGPLDVGLQIGTDEAARPVVHAASSGFLPSADVAVLALAPEGPLAQTKDTVTVAPLTSEWTHELSPLRIHEPGRYRVRVRYAGQEAEVTVQVVPGHLGRRLLGVEVVPRGLSGAPLLEPAAMAAPDGETRLIEAVREALKAAVPNARRIQRFAQPLEAGPFQGRSVAQVMADADEDLVRRFLEAVLDEPGMLLEQDAVNAFAEWVARSAQPAP